MRGCLQHYNIVVAMAGTTKIPMHVYHPSQPTTLVVLALAFASWQQWKPADEGAARAFLQYRSLPAEGTSHHADDVSEYARGWQAVAVAAAGSQANFPSNRSSSSRSIRYLPFLFVKDYKTASEAVYETLFHYIKGVCVNGKQTNLNDYCSTGKLGHGSVRVRGGHLCHSIIICLVLRPRFDAFCQCEQMSGPSCFICLCRWFKSSSAKWWELTFVTSSLLASSAIRSTVKCLGFFGCVCMHANFRLQGPSRFDVLSPVTDMKVHIVCGNSPISWSRIFIEKIES